MWSAVGLLQNRITCVPPVDDSMEEKSLARKNYCCFLAIARYCPVPHQPFLVPAPWLTSEGRGYATRLLTSHARVVLFQVVLGER